MNDTTTPRRRSVVIIDDHESSRRYAAELSRGLGLRVASFADPRLALRRIPALQPELLVVDLNLPGMGGLELLRRLRADWSPGTRWPRVVMVSAEEPPAGGVGTGLVACFLRKPVAASGLRRAFAPESSGEPADPPQRTLHELRGRFAAELSEGLENLDRCLAQGLREEAALIVHRLLGGSAVLGEEGLERRLRTLLQACREGAGPRRLARQYYELRAISESALCPIAEPGLPG